jgi:hypothetical protein
MLMKLGMAILALAMLAGCSSETSKPAESETPQPKAPEVVTGRTAFQKMFIAARGWQRDAQPYRLQSQYNKDSKGRDGKSAIWNAWFASPAARLSKPYSWSGTDSADAPARGVSPGNQDTYSPTNMSTQVFDVQFLKVDSDKAIEVAQKHGGDKQLEKNPDLNVFYLLDWNSSANELVWHVIYGDTRDQAKLKVAVNASTGEFLRVEK